MNVGDTVIYTKAHQAWLRQVNDWPHNWNRRDLEGRVIELDSFPLHPGEPNVCTVLVDWVRGGRSRHLAENLEVVT